MDIEKPQDSRETNLVKVDNDAVASPTLSDYEIGIKNRAELRRSELNGVVESSRGDLKAKIILTLIAFFGAPLSLVLMWYYSPAFFTEVLTKLATILIAGGLFLKLGLQPLFELSLDYERLVYARKILGELEAYVRRPGEIKGRRDFGELEDLAKNICSKRLIG